MRTRIAWGSRLVAVALSLAAAVAATAPATRAQGPEAKAPGVRASALMGRTIGNELGWEIGEILDIVLDPQDGRLLYLVVSPGSRFQMPEEPVAQGLPASEFEFTRRRVRAKLDSRDLRRLDSVEYFHEEELDPAVRARACSGRALLGAKLRDARGERLGNVSELVLDLEQARLKYAIVNYTTSRLGSAKRVALERLQPGGGCATLVVERDHLEQAAGFADPAWPGLHDEGIAERVVRFLAGP